MEHPINSPQSIEYNLNNTLLESANTSHLFNILSNEEFIKTPLEFPYFMRTTATIVCAIVLTIGTTGNLLVPIVVIKTKELRNSTNLFLINLSIADLLVLIVCVPTVFIELHTKPEIWHLGNGMCKAVPFVEMVVAHSSILTISAISFERYYAICKPLTAGYTCTKMRACIIIILVWTIAIISTSPMLLITDLTYAEYLDGSIQPVCLSRVQSPLVQAYFLLIFVTFFALPFLILIIIYGLIAKHLVLDSRNVCSSSEQYQMRLRKQVVFMLAAVMINFFICLLPFRIFSIWIILAPQEKVDELGMQVYYNLLYFCRIMLYINSAANPILYNICSTNFRRGFCQALGIGRLHRRILRRGTSVLTSTTMGSSSIKSRSTMSSNNNYNANCNASLSCFEATPFTPQQIGNGNSNGNVNKNTNMNMNMNVNGNGNGNRNDEHEDQIHKLVSASVTDSYNEHIL